MFLDEKAALAVFYFREDAVASFPIMRKKFVNRLKVKRVLPIARKNLLDTIFQTERFARRL